MAESAKNTPSSAEGKAIKQQYFFPEHGVIITATSREEAEATIAANLKK